jgi:hypothetical protein
MNAATGQPRSSKAKEHDALAQLIDRLKRQFPHSQPGHIEHLVHTHHADFEDRPVRDFVPIFVELAVRAILDSEARADT